MTAHSDPKLEGELDEIMDNLVADMCDMFDYSTDDLNVDDQKRIILAKAALFAIMAREKAETEKAYGGCQKCYGKGYSTWRHGETYRSQTSNMRDDMKFCTCDRGKQLEELIARENRRARIDEVKHFKNLSTLRLFKDVGSEYHINARHVEYRLQELEAALTQDDSSAPFDKKAYLAAAEAVEPILRKEGVVDDSSVGDKTEGR